MTDIITAVIVSVLVGLAPQLLTFAHYIITAMFFNVIVVSDLRKVSSIDTHIGKIGYCSSRQSRAGNPPGDGLHWFEGTIAHRETTKGGERSSDKTSYTLYVRQKNLSGINSMLSGDSNDVLIRWVYVPVPWRVSITDMYQAVSFSPYSWQTLALREIMIRYLDNNHMASVLLIGEPGKGKSSIADLLAVKMKRELQVEPIVVKGLDLTAKGITVDDFVQCPSFSSPLIICLDEYDTFVKHAENMNGDEGKGDGNAIAKNRSTLLSFLDRLNRTSFLIIIASTNDLNISHDPAYTRRGRFDVHINS